MKTTYRFCDHFEEEDVLRLQSLGIKVKAGFDVFTVYEDSEQFEQAKRFFGKNWQDLVLSTATEFTEAEKEKAPYLSIEPLKILGYPQPESRDEKKGKSCFPYDVYPYFENVFEIAGTSRDFGMLRGRQTGDFSFSGEPKWGKAGVGSIFWCGDAYFATPGVYEEIFRPLGITSRSVKRHRDKKTLETVVQLLPQGISESKLVIPEAYIDEIEEVPEWNIRKYMVNGKGFFPSFEQYPGNFDFFVSQEYFGDGGVNEKSVFISQRLYQRLKTNQIKGLEYRPQA